jgi:hypothetical protein
LSRVTLLQPSQGLDTPNKTMKSNLTGAFNIVFHLSNLSFAFTALMNNLKSVTPMYNLHCILKDHDEPPTPDEIAMASGKKALDGRAEAEHFKILEMSTENIKKAFEDQKAHAAVSNQFCRITFYLLPNRDHGTKKNLSDFLLNGLLPVTSLLVKLNNLSLLNCRTMCIMALVH